MCSSRGRWFIGHRPLEGALLVHSVVATQTNSIPSCVTGIWRLGLWCTVGACGTPNGGHRYDSDSESTPYDTGPFDNDSDGYPASTDCNDSDGGIHPAAIEVCNAVDDDCDELVDEEAEDASIWYQDSDGDGWGQTEITTAGCGAPSGFVGSPGDCDDGDPLAHPDSLEICDDGRDNDCVIGGAESCRATGVGWVFDHFTTVVTADDFVGISGSYNFDHLAAGGDLNGDGHSEIVVGLTQFPHSGAPQTGAAFVFDGTPDSKATSDDAVAMVTGDAGRQYVGDAIDLMGDVDDDGFDELVVGDPERLGTTQARVGIFHGPVVGSLVMADADTRITYDPGDIEFGSNITTTHDDDGVRLFVGARGERLDFTILGAVYVVDPTVPGDLTVSTKGGFVGRYWGEEQGADPGAVIHDLGDTDGDGVSDVAISCQECNDYLGIVYVELGPHTGDTSLTDADTRYINGAYVGPTGDTNGDGLADLVIRGAETSFDLYPGPTASGTVDMSATPGDAHIEAPKEERVFTVDLVGADVDGDGPSDLAIPNPYIGTFFVFYGPVSGSHPLDSADLYLYAKVPKDDIAFGWSIESLGDTDHDGHDDLVVSDNKMNLYVMYGQGI